MGIVIGEAGGWRLEAGGGRLEARCLQPPAYSLLACLAFLLCAPWAAAVDVTGNVTDASGTAVPGARVWLIQERAAKHIDTDALGAFKFAEVASKPADIVARKDGYALTGGAIPVVGTGSVTLVMGEAGVVRIIVKNQTFDPVAGASIRTLFIADAFSVPVEDLAEDGFPAIRSQDDGQMLIPDLPKDLHIRFVVGAHDYADTAVAYLPVDGKEQRILLYPGVAVRGRVIVEGGGATPRAQVTVYKIGTGAQREAGWALTDPEGFYHLIVRPGDYLVAVCHPEYASPKSQPIEVRDGVEAVVADLTLKTPNAIDGKVEFPDGKPCPGAPVAYWIDSDPSDRSDRSDRSDLSHPTPQEAIYQEVLTQNDGIFRLKVPGEPGRIHVTPPNGFMTEHLGDIAVSGTLGAHMTIAPVRLKALPAVEGVVLGEQGVPEPNVLISSLDLEPPVWVITDAEGKFRIQLAQVPAQGKAKFRAEHAVRFLREDFEVSFESPKQVRATLKSFEPNLSVGEETRCANDLSGLMGKPAPEISCGAWFNSEALTLASLRGKVVVLTFWGGFDEQGAVRDCIERLRALRDLLKDVPDVALICIHDAGKEPYEVEQYVKSFRITFPLGRDADPFQTFGKYGVHNIPETLLIDKSGVLRFCDSGPRLLELIKVLRREG